MSKKEVEYTDYLNLNSLLDCQKLESSKHEDYPAHEEMLFILTHQTYELWFKQIIWEVDSVIKFLKDDYVSDSNLSMAVHRLKRVNEIWRVLISQITVLETMTPLEFLEFRNHLYPASGFQSAQFRMIENKLGLKNENRKTHGGCPYHSFLKEDLVPSVVKTEKEATLLSSVEKWLERTPYLKTKGFDFWKEYETSVSTMLSNESKLIKENSNLSSEQKDRSLQNIEKTRELFENFMNKELFEKNKKKDSWHLSFEALQAALFIQLYRHELKLQSANRLIEELIDLDENMTRWRNRHSQMALRMLGQKVGTGGSSGAEYLQSASDAHKVFSDFFKLTTFFIDGRKLKALPD